MTNDPIEPRAPLTREEAAHRDIGRTDTSRAMAAATALAACLALAGVPAAHIVREIGQHRRGERSAPWPTFCDLGPAVVDAAVAWQGTSGSVWNCLLEANHVLRLGLKRYETDLEDSSWLRARVQPIVQFALSRFARVGHERTQMGRDDWLFYGPELDYVARRGFLDPRELARRRRDGDRWTPPPQPDPVAAIVKFRDQLAARGMHLVVLPVPVKHGVQAERFSRRADGPVRNRSWAAFTAALEAAGVEWFDAMPVLRAAAAGLGGEAYLRTDTHWRPEAMAAVAAALADRLAPRLPPAPPVEFAVGTALVTNRGDLAVMLNTAELTEWPPAESATIHPVTGPDGQPWAPDRSADVLILGDSFCNIYSLESMGWGRGAGFAEHLSHRLRRPVDRMVRNDAGAFATRLMAVSEAALRPERIAAKRVVVWEFSERELSLGDWKPLAWPAGREKLGR